ncbi:hypothetical protein ACNM69_002870, partial [Escherichia coli]
SPDVASLSGLREKFDLTIIFVNYYPENKFAWCMIRDSCFKPSEFRGYIHVMAAIQTRLVD